MVNGFLSKLVQQGRGLRQRDPLSPVLFNLAFEPLLRTVLANSNFQGFSLKHNLLDSLSMVGPASLKVLGYADDALFFLTYSNDFHQLQNALTLYSRASNGKVNYHKAEAISLSGASQPEWQELLRLAGINAWHDYRPLSSIRYLGYPLASTSSQLSAFLEGLLVKLRIACDIHQQRGLSIQGRSTVINTLIYPRFGTSCVSLLFLNNFIAVYVAWLLDFLCIKCSLRFVIVYSLNPNI